MICLSRPFARLPEPSSPAAGGCLATLAAAGAMALVGIAACGFLATTYAFAHGAVPHRASRAVAPIAGPSADFRAARRSWGAIRARYPATNRSVPA